MDDMLSWLILIRAPMLGPVQQRRLLESFNSPSNLLKADKPCLEAAGLKDETIKFLKNPDDKSLARDVNWLQKPDHFFISIIDERYPARLKEISAPPLGLFVDGKPEVLLTEQFGIVGSRNPTYGGKQTAQSFARLLVEQPGLTITSGLALGIDYCAHIGAMEANGPTIAVLGNGLDKIYPQRHKKAADQIRNNGALVSEFPTGTPPLPAHFPRRNRIISGMSLGILVVEAAMRSGSLITAKYAVEQGREVFAIPGSIKNPLSGGCHFLIKQGAKLVETLEDIIEELNLPNNLQSKSVPVGQSAKWKSEEYDEKYRQLIGYISYDPVSVDKLIELTGLTADTVSSMLSILEIQGIVTSSGGLYSKFN